MPPLHIVLDALLLNALPAALLAALVMFVGGRLLVPRAAPAAAALALVVGMVGGLWVTSSITIQPQRASETIQPQRGSDALELSTHFVSVPESVTLLTASRAWGRFPWAVLAALAVGLAARPVWVPTGLGWPLRAGAAALAFTWAIPAQSVADVPWLPAAVILLVLLNWGLLEHLASEAPGAASVFGLGLAAFVAGGVLIQAHSMRLMESAVILSAALMGVAVVAARLGVDGGGAVPAGVVLMAGLLLMGNRTLDSAVPWPAFVLPAAAPLVLALTLLPPLKRWQGWKLRLLRLALIVIPLAAAAALSLEAGSPFGDGDTESW